MVEIRNGEDWESSYIDGTPTKRAATIVESAGKNPTRNHVESRVTAATSKFAAFEAIPTVKRALATRKFMNTPHQPQEIVDPKMNWRGGSVRFGGK